MAAVTNVSSFGQLSLLTVETAKVASGRSDLVLSASVNGETTDANKTTATFVGGVAAPTLTFATVGANAGALVQIKGLATPTADSDAVTKAYADGIAAGIDVRASVAFATAAVLDATNVPTYANGTVGVGATLTENTTTTGVLVVDGTTLTALDVGKRILVKNQVSTLTNGLYTVTAMTASSAWVLTRATDANSATNFSPGVFTFVEGGTANSSRGFVAQGPSTGSGGGFLVGTDAVLFTQFSSATALSFSHPLVLSGSNVTLTRVAPLGTTSSNELTVVGQAAGAAHGKMLVGSASESLASTYTDTFGAGAAGALALKVEPPASLPQVVANIDDTQILEGGINIAPGKTLGDTDHTPGLVFGLNTARNTTALVASNEANSAQMRLLAHNSTADSWSTIAVFSKTTV